MRSFTFAAVIILAFIFRAFAQDATCRQPWMPKDAPVFCSWRAEPDMPTARTYHSVVSVGKNIYVLGGYRYDAQTNQVIYYDDVLRSSVGDDGKLGSWVTDQSFKTARSGAAATIAGSCLFLAGGSSSTPNSLTYYDDLQSSRIGSDGKLSAWTVSANHLHTPRSNLSLVAVKSSDGTFLNAVAGVTQLGNDTIHLDTIEVAKVTNDCQIGPWVMADYHLKGGRSSPQALTLGDGIAVIGGWGDLDLLDVYDDVQITQTRDDGTPSPWQISPARLTTGIYGHATALISSPSPSNQALLLSIGGQPGTGAYANWISYAYVSPAASVTARTGIWRISPTGKLATGLAGLGVATVGDRLFVIGGTDGSGQNRSTVVSARFDFGQQ